MFEYIVVLCDGREYPVVIDDFHMYVKDVPCVILSDVEGNHVGVLFPESPLVAGLILKQGVSVAETVSVETGE